MTKEWSTPKIEQIPNKRDRYSKVLERLAEEPLASNEREAYALVERVFKAVEESEVGHLIEAKYHMRVYTFERLQTVSHSGRTVWYHIYAKDMLFLGDNGSIEIRSTEQDVIDPGSDTSPFCHFPVIFEKPGVDGRTVWQASTS